KDAAAERTFGGGRGGAVLRLRQTREDQRNNHRQGQPAPHFIECHLGKSIHGRSQREPPEQDTATQKSSGELRKTPNPAVGSIFERSAFEAEVQQPLEQFRIAHTCLRRGRRELLAL